MNILKNTLMVAALSMGLTFAVGNVFAQVCDPKDPKCEPPKDGADCSPGYYKKHPEVWCGIAITDPGDGCDATVALLSAERGATRDERDAAKAILDAYYGTAANSPCEDDD